MLNYFFIRYLNIIIRLWHQLSLSLGEFISHAPNQRGDSFYKVIRIYIL